MPQPLYKFSDKPWFKYPKFTWNKQHAIIIGGGIAGCQTAWHLLQTGWQVTLIERHNKLATEASGNVAGAILPKMTAIESLGEDFYTQAFNYTLKQLTQLTASSQKIQYDLCGVIQLAHNSREDKRWKALQQRDFSSDFLQCLDSTETQRQSGICTPYKSTYFPQGGWINPASFCQALINHPHCKVILESEAISLKKVDENWLIQDKNQQIIASAEVVIITSGKDINQLAQTEKLPIMPVLGQTTQAQATQASSKLKTVIGHEGYLTPAIEGQHIFGATFERHQHQAVMTAESDNINQQQLHQYLPEFSDSLGTISSSHAAIRMTTPDRFPYAGALINSQSYKEDYNDIHQGKHWKEYPVARYQQGLFVLAGLGSRGLTTAGYCANQLVDIINGKQLDDKITQALHAGRFMVKRLKTKVVVIL